MFSLVFNHFLVRKHLRTISPIDLLPNSISSANSSTLTPD